MRTWFLAIFISIFISGHISGQETNIKSPKEKTPKIEIKANSRSQMSVVRDNYHRRRDLRFLQMNKKMRINKRQMKAYYISQIKRNKNSIDRQQKNTQRKALQKKQMQRKRLQLKRRRTR